MINQSPPLTATPLSGFGRRRVKPTAAVVDSKPHVREFIREALEDIGFVVEDGDTEHLVGLIAGRKTDLVMLGLSAGGIAGSSALETLNALGFDGQILIFAQPEMPMTAALLDLGDQFGLTMLPLLPIPFSDGVLRQAVNFLVPQEPPALPTVDAVQALHAGWLELWYQSKINVRSLTIDGAEGLIRLRHPAWGVMPPAQFLPDPGDPTFTELSSFVVAQAAADWQAFVADHGHVELAINLPLIFFKNLAAVEKLIRQLPAHPAFKGLIVEINARELANNLDLAIAAARQLRFFNIGISIDDVGADWPILMKMDDCPFVELKVDRTFVTGAADDRLKQSTCRRIIDLADTLGARTVAEGVETRADFVMARELGFDLIQGYFFGKPMEARKFAKRILREPVKIA
ncbi:MAG: EAL domain-containing response regulator [Pseudolabrys sp.]|jgi:EAL domain-containing protein (putative c-di-GMP-specific phosphodiesterase class I)